MHLVLSGEGNSDIGKLSHSLEEFIPAPMYYLIDKIIEQQFKYSFYELTPELITFIPKKRLLEESKKFKSFAGKKKGQSTAIFYKNARALAKIAQDKSKELNDNDVIAILFRDSDGTVSSINGMWEDKVKSIEYGFKFKDFNRGVAMVPKPKSEAWLICALKDKSYENCQKLEDRSGNDDSPNSLKKELDSLGIDSTEINEMIQNGTINIEKIDMPSFKYFVDRLNRLL
ncbi:MAG TPA: hypothetical protein ENK88_06135 [Campylobacterales bacterium]|nr:hypothetical protein [Campylobacterales bacterium]